MNIVALQNIDIVVLGLAISALVVYGVAVFIINPASIIRRTLFALVVIHVAYLLLNFFVANSANMDVILWMLHGVFFSAVWSSFFLFQTCYVFPDDEVTLPRWYKFLLFPFTIVVSLMVLTPVMIRNSGPSVALGGLPSPEFGNGIILFGLTCGTFIVASLVFLVRKIILSSGVLHKQTVTLLIGASFSYIAILILNVVFPLIFHNANFTVFAPLMLLPFLFANGVAVFRYDLFNIRIASIALTLFLFSFVMIMQVLFTADKIQLAFGIAQFSVALMFGAWLMRAMWNEIAQRERIEHLMIELQDKNEQLIEIDHKRLEFLSFASHQLRAPLTSIRGFASMILDFRAQELNKDVRDWVSNIFESSSIMGQTIEDFLNTSRLDSGEMKFEFADIDVVKLVSDVVGRLKPIAERKGLSFSFVIMGGESAVMRVDKAKIEHIITNLIDNSIKYTKEGWVKVIVTITDKIVRIQVDDSGAGIKPELMGRLFKRWSRLEQTNVADIKGTGLGLFIVHEMVSAHNGTVRAESGGEGKGSSFTVELPRGGVLERQDALPLTGDRIEKQRANTDKSSSS